MLNQEQRHELMQGIGASECAAVLGIDPYKTPYELWLEKTGRVVNDISNEPQIIMGNLLEPVIAKRYAQLTGEKVARVNRAILHKQYPHMLCHLDRKVVGKRKGVEIKTANPFSSAWGEAGTDEIPPNYIAQVQHQLACTGFEEEDLIVFRGTTDLRIYNFKPDEKIINHIIKKVDHFWNYHVKGDMPPAPTTRGDLKHLFPINNGNFIEVTPEVLKFMDDLSVVKWEISNFTTKKEFHEKQIIEFIADNDGIKQGDEIIATFKADKNGTRRLNIKKRA
jgi:putative phage-type endonuclease